MKVLEFGGEKFVKASEIARQFGYTSDYVGQLCRAGKIDAQLVGRSWYVHEDSLKHHKSNRHRSSKTKTHSALKAEVQKVVIKKNTAPKIPTTLSGSKHFYDKIDTPNYAYSEDQSELIPTLTQKPTVTQAKLSVAHADAKSIAVEKGESYQLEASERPKISFKGALHIKEVEDQEIVIETADESKIEVKKLVEEPVPVASKAKPVKPAIIKANPPKTKIKKSVRKQKMGLVRVRSASQRADAIDPTAATVLHIQAEVVEERVPISYRSAFTAVVAACGLGFILSMGVGQTIAIDKVSDEYVRSYEFNAATILEVFKG